MRNMSFDPGQCLRIFDVVVEMTVKSSLNARGNLSTIIVCLRQVVTGDVLMIEVVQVGMVVSGLKERRQGC